MRSLRIVNPKVYSFNKLGMMFGVHANMACMTCNEKWWKSVETPTPEQAQLIVEKWRYTRRALNDNCNLEFEI